MEPHTLLQTGLKNIFGLVLHHTPAGPRYAVVPGAQNKILNGVAQNKPICLVFVYKYASQNDFLEPLSGRRCRGRSRGGGRAITVRVPHGRLCFFSAVLPETSVQLLPITPGMPPGVRCQECGCTLITA